MDYVCFGIVDEMIVIGEDGFGVVVFYFNYFDFNCFGVGDKVDELGIVL